MAWNLDGFLLVSCAVAWYNIALENITFLMNKNCVPVDNSFVVESVTDYFLMSEGLSDNKLHDMSYIIENSKFFTNEELSGISYLCIDEDAILEAATKDVNKANDFFERSILLNLSLSIMCYLLKVLLLVINQRG